MNSTRKKSLENLLYKARKLNLPLVAAEIEEELGHGQAERNKALDDRLTANRSWRA